MLLRWKARGVVAAAVLSSSLICAASARADEAGPAPAPSASPSAEGQPAPAPTQAKDAEKKPEEKKDFSIGVGATIFSDYTYTDAPTSKDSDGNTINPSTFEVRRTYVTVQGKANDFIAFRITGDIAGRLATTGASTNYDGNLVFRLKYAYAQFNLDKVTKGSWIRFGQHHTPYVDFWEHIYRYRFQGTTFAERNGYISSSDVGVSAHFNFKGDYGDVHAGFYNGDTYSHAEANDQKAFQVRLTLRPVPKSKNAKGFRLTGFYDLDHPVQGADRKRFIGALSFEHKYLNAGFEYVDAKDSASATKAVVSSDGWSVFVTPKLQNGLEALFRYDWTKPNKSVDATKKLTLFGVAYWFKTQHPQIAVMADYENVKYSTALSKPEEKRFEVKTLVDF
jgi:Phosphate-selective porin O and P